MQRLPDVLPPFRWKQGEHIFVSGRTGSGKSTLAERILDSRRYLVVFRSKADDTRYRTDRVVKTKLEVRQALKDPRVERLEIAPPRREQGETFYSAMEPIFDQGGWTVYIDEGFRWHELGLEPEFNELITEGRSKKISVVRGTQRPVFVSRFSMSEASHAVSFHAEGRDLLTLRDSYGRQHADTVSTLNRADHEFAWTGPDGSTWAGKLQELPRA